MNVSNVTTDVESTTYEFNETDKEKRDSQTVLSAMLLMTL